MAADRHSLLSVHTAQPAIALLLMYGHCLVLKGVATAHAFASSVVVWESVWNIQNSAHYIQCIPAGEFYQCLSTGICIIEILLYFYLPCTDELSGYLPCSDFAVAYHKKWWFSAEIYAFIRWEMSEQTNFMFAFWSFVLWEFNANCSCTE